MSLVFFDPSAVAHAVQLKQQRHNTTYNLSIDRGESTFTNSWSSIVPLMLAVIVWLCSNTATGSVHNLPAFPPI
eukprot:3082796-Amphidinium_carterae.1